MDTSSVVKKYLLLRVSIVRLPPAPRLRRTWQLRWSRRKNPPRISDLGELSRVVDALPPPLTLPRGPYEVRPDVA